ncbi:DUF3298 domain-containing protein [Mariniflexile jejuense]|uniref:DUF3298 domain-containing protein n=1 Tax=Mariniflexile jejuense TaxID=1173582 RepID=A0ABW3JKM9_9FLAO
MLLKKYTLILCLFFILFNCKEELTITFIETKITTSNNNLVEVTIPKAIENSIISSEINTEVSNLVIAALQVGDTDTKTSKSIEESINAFNNEYNAFNTEFPNISQPWEAQIDGEILFQSHEVISISITSYVNTGGAHGSTHISFLNFNAATGKRIKNNDLIKNKAAFETVAKTYFNTAIEDEDDLFEPNEFKLPENIGFTENSIILLYNQYEIAPYSTGIIDFTIPIEKVSAYLSFNSSN